jgi:hypothetical protein
VGPANDADTHGNTISLTLGENITLVGRRDGQHSQETNQGTELVRVWRGANLFMEAGSMITGHANFSSGPSLGSGAAVHVAAYGTFTMRGGEITGNWATSTIVGGANVAGGVFVNAASSRFYMGEGSIVRNNVRGALPGTPFDIVVGPAVPEALYQSLSVHPGTGVVFRRQ